MKAQPEGVKRLALAAVGFSAAMAAWTASYSSRKACARRAMCRRASAGSRPFSSICVPEPMCSVPPAPMA